jgi:hypothetical protein
MFKAVTHVLIGFVDKIRIRLRALVSYHVQAGNKFAYSVSAEHLATIVKFLSSFYEFSNEFVLKTSKVAFD